MFMTGNAENINNALLDRCPAGHRWNTVKDVDIIPFSFCQKRKSFLQDGEVYPCDDIMETDELWENLSLPFSEIRTPHINIATIYNPPWLEALIAGSTGGAGVEDARRIERSVTGLTNHNSDNEKRFLAYYDQRLRQARRCWYGRVSADEDKIARRKANAMMHINRGAGKDEIVTMNSILLCKGYGGIIHPKNDGQINSRNLMLQVEWALSLPKDEILDDGAYTELARIFLYELDEHDMATFISRCFYYLRTVPKKPGTSHTADVWRLNEERYEQILFAMSELVGKYDLQDRKSIPFLNLQHRYSLFDFIQYIQYTREPASEVGASGPYISINQEITDSNDGSEFDFYLVCNKLVLSRGVAVFSDDAIGIRYRIYQTEQTAYWQNEFGLTHEDVLSILACSQESREFIERNSKR